MTQNFLPLQAGEIRTATQRNGNTVTMQWVAGGMFAAVEVRDASGGRTYGRTFQYDTDAINHFNMLAAQ
jgi:hypothetical protein